MRAEKKPEKQLDRQLAEVAITNPELAHTFERICQTIERHESAKIHKRGGNEFAVDDFSRHVFRDTIEVLIAFES